MMDQEFLNILQSMSKEELDAYLVSKGAPFDTFATSLGEGEIEDLALPFAEYAAFGGSLLDFYKAFFQKYDRYLHNIDDNTWDFVNVSMSVFCSRCFGQTISFDILEEIRRLETAILSSLEAYLNGSPNVAYEALKGAFVENNNHLFLTIPQVIFRGSLYRARNTENLQAQKELFHTPFEFRNSCGSYRYSILGYPSLYLAGSLETALAECRIKTDEYSCVCFYPNQNIRCVDLTLPNRKLAFFERYSFVLFYPLIMACGLIVKDENSPFKPEYVISQILFQVIKENSDLMGVSYTSTRVHNPDFRNNCHRNFVLIVPDANMASGQSSKLASIFKCTMPASPNGENVEEMANRLRQMERLDIVL